LLNSKNLEFLTYRIGFLRSQAQTLFSVVGFMPLQWPQTPFTSLLQVKNLSYHKSQCIKMVSMSFTPLSHKV